MEIVLCINGQQLEAHYPELYSGSVGVLYVKFAEVDFDSTLIKAVRFKTAQSDWYTADITDGAVKVPHEVIIPGGFDIALAGYEERDGTLTKFLPTNSVHIDVLENGYGEIDAPLESESEPESYTAQVERLVSEAAETADRAKSTAESALTGLDNKANAADVYTKAEADGLLEAKVDKESGKGLSAVSDVNLYGVSQVIIRNGTPEITELPVYNMVVTQEDGTKEEYGILKSEHRESFDHPAKSVTSVKLADKAVTMAKLADDVVTEIDKKADAEAEEGTIIRTGTSIGEVGTVTDVMNIAAEAKEQSQSNKAEIEELQSEKADKAELETKADAELLKKLMPKATVVGNPVTLTDHAEGVAAINYRIYGNSVQDGTPSPDNPVEIQSVGDLIADEADEHYGKYDIPVMAHGKNLFDKNNCKYIIGYFTRTVTTMTSHANARTIYIPCEPDTTYTISRDTAYQQFHFGYTTELPAIGVNVLGAVTASNVNINSLTITTGADAKYLVVYLYNGYSEEGATEGAWEAIVGGLQIEYGAVATEYETYVLTEEHIYAQKPLMKVGTAFDYVDFQGKRIVRNVNCININGTETMESTLIDGKNSVIIHDLLPDLNSGLPCMCTHSSDAVIYNNTDNYENGTVCIDEQTGSVIWIGILDFLNTTTVEELVKWLEEQAITVSIIYALQCAEYEAVETPSLYLSETGNGEIYIKTPTAINGNMEVTYLQDINKKLSELQSAITAMV